MTKGFTLIELLITLILVITLATVGVASYSSLLQKNEQQVIIDELKAAIAYAKTQAIILGTTVSLGPLDDSSNWSNGLKLTAINKPKLLYEWAWRHPRWNMTWNGPRHSKQLYLSNNPSRAISNGRFILNEKGSENCIVLILNRLGRMKTKQLNNQDIKPYKQSN